MCQPIAPAFVDHFRQQFGLGDDDIHTAPESEENLASPLANLDLIEKADHYQRQARVARRLVAEGKSPLVVLPPLEDDLPEFDPSAAGEACCSNCLFYVRGTGAGQCRRYPVAKRRGKGYWCGEWKPARGTMFNPEGEGDE